MVEILQLFKGENVTWVLTVAMLIGLFFLGKFIRDVFNNMLKETKELQEQIKIKAEEDEQFYREQLKIQKEEAEKREKELKDELSDSREKAEEERSEFIEQLKENTKATNEIVSTLKEMNFRIENIERGFKHEY